MKAPKKTKRKTKPKRKTKKTSKISNKEKKAYALVGFSILGACAFLLVVSFFLLPKITHFNTDTAQANEQTESQSITSEKEETISKPQPKVQKDKTEKPSPLIKKEEAKKTTSKSSTQRKSKTAPTKKTQTKNTETKTDAIKQKPKTDVPQPPAKIEKDKTPPKHIGTLYFVFDDAGHNFFQLEKFLQLPFKCTFAVLPGLPNSKSISKKIRDAGFDTILHQPMQAVNLNLDPGPQAITKDMSPDATLKIIEQNLEEVGPVIGMNNHEGSLITTDENLMRAILQFVKEKNILFLDSRTNSETVAPKIAKELNMKILERDVFLDNIKTRDEFRKQLKIGLQYAKNNGYAILIGHVFSTELAEFLIEVHSELCDAGYTFSGLSDF